MRNDSTRGYRPRVPGRSVTDAFPSERSTRHPPAPTRRRTQPTIDDPYLRREHSLNSIRSWLGAEGTNDGPSVPRTVSPVHEDSQYQESQYEVRHATKGLKHHSTHHDRPLVDERVYDDRYAQQEYESEGEQSSVRFTPPSSPDTALHQQKPYVAHEQPQYESDDWPHDQHPEPTDYDPRDGGRRDQSPKGSYYDDGGRLTDYYGVEIMHESTYPDETQYEERPRYPRRPSVPDDLESLDRYADKYRADHDPPALALPRRSRHSINSEDAGHTPRRGSPVTDHRTKYREPEDAGYGDYDTDSDHAHEQAPTNYSRRDLQSPDDKRGNQYDIPIPPRTPVNQRTDYDRDYSPPRDDYQRRRSDDSPPQSVSSYESHRSEYYAPHTSVRQTADSDHDRPQSPREGDHRKPRENSPPRSVASKYSDDHDRYLQAYRREDDEYSERSRSPPRRDREGTRERSHPRSADDSDGSAELIPRRSKRRSKTRTFVIVQLSSSESESDSESGNDDRENTRYVGPPIRERDLYPSALARSERRSKGSREARRNSDLFAIAQSLRGGSRGSAMIVHRF
jgi:hypothetical protein